mgnify:CR=1 FL=1
MHYINSLEQLHYEQGQLEAALKMVLRFNLSVKEAAEALSIPVKELMDYMKKHDKS